jgi:hypothetical protein
VNTSRLHLCRAVASSLACIALLAPIATATDAREVRAEPTRERKIYDAVVLRPLAFGNLMAGSVCFVIAYPITLMTGGTGHVRRYCWDEPVDRVFRRPLGEL